VGVTVLLPEALAAYAGGVRSIEVPATSLGEALDRLAGLHPSVRPYLFDERGALRAYVNAFVNHDDARGLGGVAAPVNDGDTITIVPSIAGGTADSDGTDVADPKKASIEPIVDGTDVALDSDEIRRYSRHLIMPEVGMDGQKRLKAAKVLCVGAGGLGSPVALYLAAAGIGTLGIVDFDVVDETNLQRQIMHGTRDVGRPKIASATDRLRDTNPNVRVVAHEMPLRSDNALDIIEAYDVVIDGTDNFPTRYLVNDACVLLGKPNVYGSIFRFDGQLSVFWAERGPCYRCLFREPPPPGLVPSCAEGGVLGVLPGIVGTMQALEAIKLIIGRGDPMIGRLLLIDALRMRFRELTVRRDPACPVCGEAPSIRGLIDYDEFCGIPQAAAAQAATLDAVPSITAKRLHDRLAAGDRIVLVDVREPHEWEITNLGRHDARLIPLGSLIERMNELDTADEIVLYCRSGNRSAQALTRLRDAGFRKLWNLEGGLLAWSEDVDPSVPRY
jgi:molybdopterin/thiamine biosynthesis adenylyltransferase/rhodanese-related sulfurtransferase/molybdopterin converting factor small subunit